MEPLKPRKLRIGIATDGLEERVVDGQVRIANGGVGVYIYQLIKQLLEMDQDNERDNEFVLMRYGTGALDIYRHPRVVAVFFPKRRGGLVRQILDRDHRRVARDYNLDLIHYPNQFGGLFLPSTIRRVVTLHDLTPLIFPTMHPRRRVFAYKVAARRALRRADRIMVDSNHTGKDVAAFDPYCTERLVTVYPGVGNGHSPGRPDPDFPIRKQLFRPYLLTVGVLEPRKNHALLLIALDRLVKSGYGLDLVIIGRPGWRWADPRQLPEFASVSDRVHIRADVADDEMADYYRHAAVFVYPSWYEGFGLPVVEAMACGTPVVCSNSSSLPEAGGAAALYADPADPQSFVTQIRRVLDDDMLRRQMVASGLEQAGKLSWIRTASETLRVYRSVALGDSSLIDQSPGSISG